MYKLEYVTKCSHFHLYILKSFAKVASTPFPILVLLGRRGSRGEVLPQCSTTVPQARLCRNLSVTIVTRVFIPLLLPRNGSVASVFD
jgi:hypothetical protein